MRWYHLTILYCGMIPAATLAQGPVTIEEIVVTAAQTRDRVSPQSVVLGHEELQEFQPVATADVFRNVTGVSMRTNSRGESVIRIRGAEERQTLVFLDGAPLSTPWDGRANLALLPAGLVDSVEITRGAVPTEYGANAIAGAVDLSTLQPGRDGAFRAEMQLGTLDSRNVNLLGGTAFENGWSFTLGASQIQRDAERIADPTAVAFDPSVNRERTNTDLSGETVYLASGYTSESLHLRASILHADVERGVAAQGDLDPAVSSPRFWRVPDWRLVQTTLNAGYAWSPDTNLKLTAWHQRFDQTIDAYRDYSYDALDERETGADDTVGARLVLSHALDRSALRFVATTQESTHDNQEFATGSGLAIDFVADPSLRYRQRLHTLGAEYDFRISDTLTSTFGLARDSASTPLTGDKPPLGTLDATGWSSGLRWSPSDEFQLALTLGARTRFPTPRELYGAALGRFLPNPDLQAERALLGDLSAKWSINDDIWLDLALWLNESDDTLSQRRVDDNGVSRRQRYNTSGSSTYGLDASMTWFLTSDFRTELSTALQGGQMNRDANGTRPPLLQRPKSQWRAALDWQANDRIDLRAEFLRTGSASDIADDGSLATLPASTSINLRGFLELDVWTGREVHFTVSVDNLTDELVLPQLGLPAAGRSIRAGIRIN